MKAELEELRSHKCSGPFEPAAQGSKELIISMLEESKEEKEVAGLNDFMECELQDGLEPNSINEEIRPDSQNVSPGK